VCFRKSVFNHSKKFLNLIGAFGGLAGVVLFFSADRFGWLYGLIALSVLLFIFVMIFFKYAELELIDNN